MNTNPDYKKINLRKEYPNLVGNTDFAVRTRGRFLRLDR